jgi:uncharacterized membrane protein YvbJ
MPFCTRCGAKLQETARFCSRCGKATQREAVDLADSITDTAKTVGREIELAFKTAVEEMEKALGEVRDDLSKQCGPYCPKCGKRNPRDAKFCLACGGNIPSAA